MTDWIKWNSGPCPVPLWQMVEVRIKSESDSFAYYTPEVCKAAVWGTNGIGKADWWLDGTIAEYRIVKED